VIYFAYLRVSDRHQVAGDGFARQVDTIDRWLRSQADEHELVKVFQEEGHTGTDFDRPALGELLAICQDRKLLLGEINPNVGSTFWSRYPLGCPVAVLVERSDRLARDNLVAELVLEKFRECGVQVVDCEADLELTSDDDPSKVLIRQILQAISQFEKSSIVKKLRAARDRKRAVEGRCEGAKPFGHYQSEKAALAHILDMSRAGRAAGDIAGDLNARVGEGREDLLPRRGKRWNRGTIHKIIKAHEVSD
jgi:DNA invertase Pin-like site-specific DNA recombinase